MTRNRCIRGWTVFVIVVLMLQMAGGVELAAAAQEPSPPISGRSLGNLVPQSDARVERIVGKEAWALLEEKVIKKQRAAWDAALRRKEARGWRKTDKIVAFRMKDRIGLTRTQAQAFDIGDALIIEWEWHCDPYAVCGTYYFESRYDGGSITYDAEFVPTSDWGGYSPWANYIASNPGRDSRRERQASRSLTLPKIRLAGLEAPQRAPDDANCPGDLWEWNRCMRDCLSRKHAASLGAAAGAAGGMALACTRAIRPGPLVAVGATYLGCMVLSAGGAVLSSFTANHWYSPCDSGAECGPKPC
jgi:hypothetical protein